METWHPFYNNCSYYFPYNESLIKYYLRPNVSRFLIEQMKESLYYNANQPSIEEVELLADDEPAITEDIEDEPDKVVLCAKYLLENLEQSEIKELQPFTDNKVEKPIDEEFINERIYYRKAWGMACTVLNKYVLYRDDEFIHLIENYLERVRAKKEELIKTQEASTQASSNNNIVEFMNPRKVIGKGRPKGTSHYSESTPQETSSKKKREYTCGFCKESGHNITTCPDRR
ncbi:hypothetical protein C2G38_2028849 [Gigaspora rosea]|uniref:CCHC-type domain-containing protein n=1 Tax=Gigaspora rosea TaxID=44941 RepID=A0A397W413_9GLOM|nr:hypothetical protein C2G38_2028849 [Gigaspora rosea]